MPLRYYRARQPRALGDVVIMEQAADYSRDRVVLKGPGGSDTVTYEPGTALGQISLGGITSAVTGTGNGTRTQIARGPLAQQGAYRAVYVSSDPATWEVFDPNGNFLGTVATGTKFEHPQIEFQISAGGTAWVVGAVVTFTVAFGSGQYVPVDFEATDGSQHFAGVCGSHHVIEGTDTANSFAVVRSALLKASEVLWPDGATEDQIAKAIAAADLWRGIVVR